MPTNDLSPAHANQPTGTCASQPSSTNQLKSLRPALHSCALPAEFVGISSSLRRLLLKVDFIGTHLQLATIEGEAGTGKHLLAQTIHSRSVTAGLPFHRQDAREWLANEVDASQLSGTLYLDRVDLLAPLGQGLLLNFLKLLQNIDAAPKHFLLLVSSHASLRQLAALGLFLPDLAFPLTAARFMVPPLREHREDIAPITQALMERICHRYHQPTAVLAPGTLPRLLQHSWSGNVRELISVLESAILESITGILRPSDLSFGLNSVPAVRIVANPNQFPAPPQNRLPEDLSLDTVIFRHIQLVLEVNHGNKLRAARQLGISRSTLYRILRDESTSLPLDPIGSRTPTFAP